jgi:hypothetical protein
MSMYTGRQVVGMLQQQRAELTEALGAAQSSAQKHKEVRGELENEYRTAFNDLGASLLPTLDPQTLQWAVQVTGYAPFQSSDPIAMREQERASLQQQLAAIENDPAFRDRELQRHPRTGTLITRMNELQEHRRPWAEVLQNAAHERIERLLEVGYGTEDYKVPFWRLSYYSDWEAGDQILEKFPGKKDFGEVRKEILQARETVSTLETEILDLQRQINEGIQLEQRHAELSQALASVDERYLSGARAKLAEHMLGIEPKWMNPRLANAPNVQLHYLRASGLGAKARYLDAMVEQHAGTLQTQLAPAIQKIDRDLAKFQRPKNYNAYFPADVINQKMKSRRERLAKQQHKFEQQYSTVYVYNDYSRGRGYDDFVWWYLMTDNRYDGGYIPEVHQFQQSHPDYVYQHVESDYDDSDAAAAVIADSTSNDVSYGVDAS